MGVLRGKMFDFDGKEHLRSRKARRRKEEDLRGLVIMYLPRMGLCLPDPLRLRKSRAGATSYSQTLSESSWSSPDILVIVLSGPLSDHQTC